MQKYKKIVIVGATSAIAEHCARNWITDTPSEIILVGRHIEKLQSISMDLAVRNTSTKLTIKTLDFLDVRQIDECVTSCVEATPPDIVLIAHGVLPNQLEAENDLALIESSLNVNAISPVIFAEAFANRMGQNCAGTIIIIGSVAGDRGRKSNYVYGSAKSLIEKYTQGLQHRFARTKLKIILVKPGPTETPMTAHLTARKDKMTPVEEVAKSIVHQAKKSKRVIYVPKKWGAIMFVIRNLPYFVFSKMNI